MVLQEITPQTGVDGSMLSGGSKEFFAEALLRTEMAIGRRNLKARFQSVPSGTLGPSELLPNSVNAVCYLRAGWACEFRDFDNGRRTIVDIYLPGDVIGLDAVLRTRRSEEVMTLTSATIQALHGEHAVLELMSSQPTALYIAWLLGQRQQRTDRLLSAILCLNAPGRLATMVLDLYMRLRRKKLITGSAYNLPLTQCQIGSYLGLTDVHVNRVLRSLRDDQIVHVERHCVTILDLARLTSLTQVWPDNSAAHIDERSSNEIACQALNLMNNARVQSSQVVAHEYPDTVS